MVGGRREVTYDRCNRYVAENQGHMSWQALSGRHSLVRDTKALNAEF
jgi:hypothetical protein